LPLAASSQELVLESAVAPTSSGGAPTTTISPEASLTEGIISNGVCFSDASSHVNLLTGDMHNWGSGEVLQFGACSDQFAISIALNEALAEAGSGISLDKIHYRWEWINGCFNVTKPDGSEIYCDSDIENRLDENFQPTGEYADQFDELNIVVTITDSNDNIIEQRTYDYETWFHWNRQNEHSTNETTQTEENGAVWQITEDDIELFNHLMVILVLLFEMVKHRLHIDRILAISTHFTILRVKDMLKHMQNICMTRLVLHRLYMTLLVPDILPLSLLNNVQ
jgi:hypothetical protein